MRFLHPLPLFLLLFTACASHRPQYQLTIGNAHEHLSLRAVEVESEGRLLRRFETIAPVKQAALKPERSPPPEEVLVRWTAVDGSSHSARVALDGAEDFNGQLALEITEAHDVTLTRIPAAARRGSTLPWATPESWEGTLTLPGFSER